MRFALHALQRACCGIMLVLAATTSAASEELAEAEVRRVDISNRKITLRHGEIKNLQMPPMSMVFNVNDPSLLEKVKPGDKIRFRAVEEGGKLIVTEIHK